MEAFIALFVKFMPSWLAKSLVAKLAVGAGSVATAKAAASIADKTQDPRAKNIAELAAILGLITSILMIIWMLLQIINELRILFSSLFS